MVILKNGINIKKMKEIVKQETLLIHNNELNSNRYNDVMIFLDSYFQRTAKDKEKNLIKYIYGLENIDSKRSYQDLLLQKKSQYQQLENFINSLSDEDIENNIYLYSAKYIFDNCLDECQEYLNNIDLDNENIYLMPSNMQNIILPSVPLNVKIPDYIHDENKKIYINILDTDFIESYVNYNKIVSIIKKIGASIYNLTLWNLIAENNYNISLEYFYIKSKENEKVYSLKFKR